MMINSKTVTLIAAISCIFDIGSVSGFSGQLSRRQSLHAVVGGIATAALPSVVPLLPANAVVSEETPRVVTRMGGLLVGILFSCYFLCLFSKVYLILTSASHRIRQTKTKIL
jgi:hypothetical protein